MRREHREQNISEISIDMNNYRECTRFARSINVGMNVLLFFE